jgi:hypothetical protein
MAKVTISTDYDLAMIAAAAGSTGRENILYDHEELTVPDVTQAALDTAVANFDMAAHNKRVAALEVTHARAKTYASWRDQNDMQYHDLVDGTTTWRDHVAAVKAAHPKPD